MASQDQISPELRSYLKRAAEFHGHLGPFLVIGIRIGIIGIEKLACLKAQPAKVTASLPLRVPFSCTIDGLQFSTQCTIGNQKLLLEEASDIEVKFEGNMKGQERTITLSRLIFSELKSRLLREDTPKDEVRKLAWKIARMPDSELFEVC